MGDWVSDNHTSADAYLGSALPFATGSLVLTTTPVKVEFPYVTRWIQITSVPTTKADEVVRVGFTVNGVNGNPASQSNYIMLSGSATTERLELKVKELYLRTSAGTCECSVLAGYTGIPKKNYPHPLSASNSFSGVG